MNEFDNVRYGITVPHNKQAGESLEAFRRCLAMSKVMENCRISRRLGTFWLSITYRDRHQGFSIVGGQLDKYHNVGLQARPWRP